MIDPEKYQDNLQHWLCCKYREELQLSWNEAKAKNEETGQGSADITDGQQITQEIRRYSLIGYPCGMYASESEMSPLYYDGTDSEDEIRKAVPKNTASNVVIVGQTSSQQSDSGSDIQCGQTRFREDVVQVPNSSADEFEDTNASSQPRVQGRSSQDTAMDASVSSTSESQMDPIEDDFQEANNSPDVEYISERPSTPIYVPNSSESIFKAVNRFATKKNDTRETGERSDQSLVPVKVATNLGRTQASRPTSTVVRASDTEKPKENELLSTVLKSIFEETPAGEVARRESVDNTPDVQTPANNRNATQTDVFDITKKKVSAEKETNAAKPASADRSCFDGFRVMMPRLSHEATANSPKKTVFPKTPAPKLTKDGPEQADDDIIDLVDSQPAAPITPRPPIRRSLHNEFEMAGQSKRVETSRADVETTPSRRKVEVTPSSRSCLKRKHRQERTSSGWLSKKRSPRVSNAADDSITPKSRRRLDVNYPSTSKDKGAEETAPAKPRSLFKPGRFTRSQNELQNDSPINVSSSEEF